jgi:hypothetical protein
MEGANVRFGSKIDTAGTWGRTDLKQIEPAITAAFRAASTESAHIRRINRSTKESRHA